MLDLTRTDLRLTELSGGSITDQSDFLAVRTPDNPGYHHGNYLLLPAPPRDLAGWVDRADAALAGSRVCLRWDGPPLSDLELARAAAAGFEPDSAIAMRVTHPGDVTRRSDLVVRPLDYPGEWDAMVAFNVAVDPSELYDAEYRRFKERLRESWRGWLDRGAATWWGALAGEQLLATCGLVDCGDLGRYQSVVTHPDHRRRGICTALVTTVAEAGLERHRALLLAADPDGPAVALYRRLGFRELGHQHALIRSGDALRVRREDTSDRAGIHSLVAAAFGRADEADLVAALRDVPRVISLVAERSGRLLGHALFTPVTVAGPGGAWDAVALGPVAARPGHQRRGVGSAVIRAGLEACREAGYSACFVLGDPAYYARFGFQPARAHDLRCAWPAPPDAFMVAPLAPGALAQRGGLVRYHPAFDGV